MSRKIQDRTFAYSFIKTVVGFVTTHSYKRFQIEGRENIPADGCTLWAPNHTNALMDPMVLNLLTKGPKVFLARADIFKSSPFIVKMLTFFKIMPVYRIRDGFESVKRNDETISRAVDVLEDGVPLVIFPEATHRAKHSLLKLSKGVFHIAYAVNEKLAGSKPVYILPIGIDYGDYFRFRSTALLRFGKPIDVTAFVREHQELTPPQQMVRLKALLAEEMSKVITFVPDDEDYDAIWEYVKLKADNPECFRKTLAACEAGEGRKLNGLEKIQAVNKRIVSEILDLKSKDAEKASEILQKVDRLRVWRIQNGVSVRSIAGNTSWPKVIMNALLALIGLPYYLFSVITCLIVWLPTLLILRHVDDDAFYNTARFGVRLGLSWIYVIGFAILFFKTLPLLPAAVLSLLLLPAYNFFTDYREFLRRGLSDVRWLLSRKKAPEIRPHNLV